MGRGLYFKRKFLTVHPSAGVVANGDFKLCRSREDGNKVRRKIESSSREAQIYLSNWKGNEENSSKPNFGLAVHVFRNSSVQP